MLVGVALDLDQREVLVGFETGSRSVIAESVMVTSGLGFGSANAGVDTIASTSRAARIMAAA